MAVNCVFKVCHLSDFHSLLESFPSVSMSYANLRVFYLLPWISNFRSAAHEFSLSRCDRGIVAPEFIRSHFRCTLRLSVWSFLDSVWTIMCQFCVQGLWPLQYRSLLGTLSIPLPVLWWSSWIRVLGQLPITSLCHDVMTHRTIMVSFRIM